MNEWKKVKIGEIINNIGGTPLEQYVSDDANYRFISIGNYTTDGKYIDNGNRIEFNEKTKEKVLNKDDLVMILNDKTTSGEIIGSTILIDKDDTYIYNQRSERIVCKDCVKPRFLWYVLNSNYFRKKIFTIAQGGTQIYVNFKDVKQIEIRIPKLEIQAKICKYLDLNEKIINSLKKYIDEVEEYKKQMIHNIFEKNIMKIGNIGKIKDMILLSGGSQPAKKFFANKKLNGYVRLIQIRDFKTNEYLTFIPKEMAKKTCQKDDIMIGRYGPPIFQILRGLEGAYNVALIKCIPKEGYLKDYIYYALLQKKLHTKIEWLSQRSSGQTGVDIDFLNNYPIILPDQQMQLIIVNNLKLLDKKIDVLKKQSKNYEIMKESLIEKLIISNLKI